MRCNTKYANAVAPFILSPLSLCLTHQYFASTIRCPINTTEPSVSMSIHAVASVTPICSYLFLFTPATVNIFPTPILD